MENRVTEYVDFLADLRGKCLDGVFWVNRKLNPKNAWDRLDLRNSTPFQHKLNVFNNPEIQKLLANVSLNKGIPIGQLQDALWTILNEIGYDKNLDLIRFLGVVLIKLCKSLDYRICVNEVQILKLRNAMGKCPVVFLPTHRSYGDFILMSLLCFTYNIQIPAIAAAIDFHGMKMMGNILRCTGAFFMRRSYSDDSDPLYWTVFKTYMTEIVTRGRLPLEFFIEGTRSRSGKSLSPKYGLLLMVLKTFFLKQVPDILVVPISISYTRILEERLFALEMLGIPKPKESTQGLLKSLQRMRTNTYGTVTCHFAEPISVRQFYAGKLPIVPEPNITDTEKRLVPSLAYHILRMQCVNCAISTFNMLALMLSWKNQLTIDEYKENLAFFNDVLTQLGAIVRLDQLSDILKVHSDLIQMRNDEQIVLKPCQNMDWIRDDSQQWKGHKLQQKTVEMALPMFMLQIYVNPILYFFVDLAVLITILTTNSNGDIFTNFSFLRGLLSQDFILLEEDLEREYVNGLKHAEQLGIIQKNPDFTAGSNQKLIQILQFLLHPFLYTYYAIMCVLKELPIVCEEKLVISTIQAEIEVNILNNPQIHLYCLSLDTIGNCLTKLISLGAISKRKQFDNDTRRTTVFFDVHSMQISDLKMELEQFFKPDFKCNLERSVTSHLNSKL